MAVEGIGRPGAGRPLGRYNAVTDKHRKYLSFLCREHTVEAVNTLVDIMKDKEINPAARVRAAENILDRGYGKAPQQIFIDLDEDIPLSEMTDEQLMAIISEDRDAVHERLGDEGDGLNEWEDTRLQA